MRKCTGVISVDKKKHEIYNVLFKIYYNGAKYKNNKTKHTVYSKCLGIDLIFDVIFSDTFVDVLFPIDDKDLIYNNLKSSFVYLFEETSSFNGTFKNIIIPLHERIKII